MPAKTHTTLKRRVHLVTEKTIKFCVSCNTQLEPCYYEDGTFSMLICPRCDY